MTILQRFRDAVQLKDDEKLRLAVTDIFWHRPSEDVVPLLSSLLLEHWHEQHEDIAHTLQQFRDPRSIDALAASLAMKFEHLERWGNEHSFKRKVTWALADIGGPRVRQILMDLSQDSDPEIARYAQKRLDAWEREAHRKKLQ